MWKPVVDYPNYEISDEGVMRNVNTGRILKYTLNPHGYYYVNVSRDGKINKLRVHRIVAKAFIPNPENKPQVNHKDGNKRNNHVNNLEWITNRENTQHAYDLGIGKLPISVVQLDLEGNYIQRFESLNKAAFAVNGSAGSITRVCKGRQRTAYGYKWRYEDAD